MIAPPEISWGAADAQRRGPIVAGLGAGAARNAIGAHAGGYSVYQALALATGALDAHHRPDLTGTRPSADIGPFAQWSDPDKIVTFDPWGHKVGEVFEAERRAGMDIRPTIAVARGDLRMAEVDHALETRRLRPDGEVLTASGEIHVTKIAIEPVWWLPGVARRLGAADKALREALFTCTGGMYPQLLARDGPEVFLPPIGGTSLYLFGDLARLGDARTPVTCRLHDECGGSDVFGSDLCTCRPYLAFGVEEAIRTAQAGGLGVVAYNRKEGRALGEVVKLLVYNARSRAEAGDRPDDYFVRTRQVAGVNDSRFQALSVDPLHWLGLKRIDRWVSMSDLKYNAAIDAGIEIAEQVALPSRLVPRRAHVEISAKQSAGYFSAAAG